MIEVFLLSLIQGVTEFLPISSSSHLALFAEYLEFENQGLSLDVSLHIGSFFAVVFYFFKDIINFFENKSLFTKILVSSLPVMIVGFFLIETGLINKIRNIQTIAWTTFIFAILLYISDKFKLDKTIKNNFTFKAAILIGLFQILSLMPGVSRSGIAITAARILNYKREDSAKISFLLSIPILGAVSIFGIQNIMFSENLNFTTTNVIAIILSFFFSFITIKFFLEYIKKFSLNIFVFYRVILGLILLSIIYL